MSYLERDQDTIFALATPPGRGGIAVIRVSGPEALQICRKCASFLPENAESHKAYFGSIKSQKNETIDEVVALYFADGRSYTGQETVEISCHGNPVLIAAISEELTQCGARSAERGEFTYRAFMNGRLDLVQAESVLDLIESKSKSAARIASRQLKGELSTQFQKLEKDLTWMLANMEADIDFSTEDIETYDSRELLKLAEKCLHDVKSLLVSYKKGRQISQGLNVAIVGKPNVGKSSLLNSLLMEDRAIVTDVAGTTRDLVHADLLIEGVQVKLTDTAGLRDTEDVVEKIGIEKTQEAMGEADVVFVVLDLSDENIQVPNKSDYSEDSQKVYVIGNKSDIAQSKIDVDAKISAKSGDNLSVIKEILSKEVRELLIDDSPVLLNARHLEKLQKLQTSIEKTIQLFVSKESPEFTSFELQEGLRAVQELLGKIYDDQVMDRVFQEFCIGK